MAYAMLEPTRLAPVTHEGALHVERSDILFYNIAPNRVRVEILVMNRSSERSQPTTLMVEAAPFGAFVPWTPLARLALPALEPGDSTILSTEASYSKPGSVRGDSSEPPPMLPPDLFESMGWPREVWSGNFKVFFLRDAQRHVERHCARNLSVYAGATNIYMFSVGHERDSYAFDVIGEAAEWLPHLVDMDLVRDPKSQLQQGTAIPLSEWVEIQGQRVFALCVDAPEYCREPHIEVHVRQQSTGETAVVEFEFIPTLPELHFLK